MGIYEQVKNDLRGSHSERGHIACITLEDGQISFQCFGIKRGVSGGRGRVEPAETGGERSLTMRSFVLFFIFILSTLAIREE